MAYVAARGTREMENLMCVPAVGLVEHQDFWNTAVQIFDPHNGYAHFGWVAAPTPANSNNSSSAGPAAARASPNRHLRALLIYSYLPYRVNAPRSSTGLGHARRQATSLRIGHARALWRYALLAAQVVHDALSGSIGVPISLSFPSVYLSPADNTTVDDGSAPPHARASSHAPGVFAPTDGVVKGAVSAFIELDEGSVNNVLVVAGSEGGCAYLRPSRLRLLPRRLLYAFGTRDVSETQPRRVDGDIARTLCIPRCTHPSLRSRPAWVTRTHLGAQYFALASSPRLSPSPSIAAAASAQSTAVYIRLAHAWS
ncbi:hypothetical protein K438DRAFT_1959907 [Mycena galopus ATCC 62051]|nr:hypothetical protein K438DRAFT_1959907 [Mycena galopus ATCC 62051]